MSNEGLSGTRVSTMNAKKAIRQNFDAQMRDNTKSLLQDLRNRMQISQTILRFCHKRNINQKMLMEDNKDRVLISLICNTEIFRSALQILWLDGDLYLQSRLRKQIRLIGCNLQWHTQYHFHFYILVNANCVFDWIELNILFRSSAEFLKKNLKEIVILPKIKFWFNNPLK